MRREHIRQILPDIKAIEESVISTNDDRSLGYHCTVRLHDGDLPGSGCHSTQSMARIISLAESMERALVRCLYSNPISRTELLLEEYPTSCGFALGTDTNTTVQRAKAEAVERWLRSKWIDEGYWLKPSRIERYRCSYLARYFLDQFDQVLAFRSKNLLQSFDETTEQFFSLIVVGIKGNGAFVGSRTSECENGLEEHALVEAWRHLQISTHIEQYPEHRDFQQIHFFGKNAHEAISQINRATRGSMPEPELRLMKQADTGFSDLFLVRALCKDFRGWHGPDITRFVY